MAGKAAVEGNPTSSYASHGINLTLPTLALCAVALYSQKLETLSSLIFLKNSPDSTGPWRSGTVSCHVRHRRVRWVPD